MDIPQLGEPQLKGQAGGGKPFLPQIVQGAAVEHVEPVIAANDQPGVPQKGQVADVARQGRGNAQLFGVGQPGAELGLVPVPPHPGKNGAPFPNKIRKGGPLRQQLQRNVHPGWRQGQQGFRLGPGGDRDCQLRGIGGAVDLRQRGVSGLPALRHGTAGRFQSRQSVPPQGVYRPGGEKQALRHIGGAVHAVKGGAAGLLQAGFQISRRQGLVLGRLRGGACGSDCVAVLVPHRQGDRLPRLAGAGEMDGHRPGIVLFVPGPGGGEQLLRLRRIFRPGAEHGGAMAALPVVLGKAGAGKGQFQVLFLGMGGLAALPDQPGVDVRDDRHVFRSLHAALQLETTDTHPLHLRQTASQAAVLQTEGIGVSGGAVEPVGQAAGLGAGAPVAAAAPDEGAEFALAGVAHAKGPVAEDLHLGGAGLAGRGGVLLGALPGDDHPLTAVLIQFPDAAASEHAHLGAGMEGQVRQGLPQQVEKAPVLHQDGVHPQAAGHPGGLQGQGQLPVRQQGVQGQKDPDAPDMAVPDGGGKFLIGEVFGAPAGVEISPAQIHRAAAALDGGPQRLRRSGGGKQFQSHYLRLSRRCWSRKTSRFSSLTSAWALEASSR